MDSSTRMVEVRDYLIARLLIENAQRPGAICNMTIEEFNESIVSKEGKITVPVSDHKSAQYIMDQLMCMPPRISTTKLQLILNIQGVSV